MSGFDAVVNVGVRLDTSSLSKFVTSYRNAVREIEAAARSATPPAPAQTQQALRAVQAQVGPGIATLQATGTINNTQAAQVTRNIGANLAELATATGTQLTLGKKLLTAISGGSVTMAQAVQAQLTADVTRTRGANAETARLRTAPKAGAAPAAPKLTEEERLAKRTLTAEANSLADRQGRANAKVKWDSRKLGDLVGEQVETEAQIVATMAEELVARRKTAGAVAQSLRGTEAVNDLTKANVSKRGLTDEVRGNTVAQEAALLEDRDPQRVAQHGLKTEEIANTRIRNAEEQAGADRAVTKSTRGLKAVIDRKIAGEDYKEATRTPKELEAAEKRRVAAVEADARKVQSETRRRQVAAEAEIVNTEKAARAAALRAANPTLIQRAQAALHNRTGQEPREPSSFATGGQLLGQGLITSARFAASAAILYGAVNSVQQMVRQASILEAEFNKIDAQFRSLGQGDQVDGFKKSIFEIAAATGEQADEVARVGFQMKGAFGGTREAIEATTSAIQIARVTGLSLVEVVDSLTAASKSFGVPITELGDEALLVQENFGVLAKETLTVFGDVGIVARQSGLSLHELGGIMGGLQQIAGRSGTALAEAIGRVLPAVGQSAGEILKLYQTVPQLAQNFPKMRDLLGSGDNGAVLLQLIRDFKDLDQTQQNALITQLGSRREAQTLIGILRQHGVILDYIDNKTKSAGKTQEYFNKLQETLSQRLDRLRRQFEQFGQAIFNAGLGDALKDIVTGGALILSWAASIGGVFAEANKATHGLAIRMLELYAAVKLISALKGLSILQGAGGIGAGTRAADAGANFLWNAAGRYDKASAAATAGGGIFGNVALPGRQPSGIGAAGTQLGAVRSAASGGLAALGLSPAVLTALAAIAVGTAYKNAKETSDKAAASFRKDIEDLSEERLTKIVEDRGNLLDQIETNLAEHLGFATNRANAKAERGQDRFAQKVALERAVNTLGPGGGRAQAAVDAPDDTDYQAAGAAGLIGDLRTKPTGWKRLATAVFEGTPVGGIAAATPFGRWAIERAASKKEGFDEIYKKAKEGDEKEVAHLESEMAKLKADHTRGGVLKLASFTTSRDALKGKMAADEATHRIITGQAIASLSEIETRYQSGMASVSEYAAAMATELAAMEAGVGAITDPDQHQQMLDQIAAIKAKQAALPSTLAQGLADVKISEIELSGGGPEDKLPILTALLKDPKFTDPAKRLAVSKQINQLEHDILLTRASRAKTAAEEVAILTAGSERAPETRIEQLVQNITTFDKGFYDYVIDVAGGADKAAELLRKAVTLAIERSITVSAALGQILAPQADAIRTQVSAIDAQIAAIDAQIGVSGPGGGRGATRNALGAQRDTLQGSLDKLVTPPASIIPIPGKKTKPDANEKAAAEERKAAEAKAAKEKNDDEAKARLEYRRAELEGDPVGQAQVAIEEAQRAASVAVTNGEKLRAKTQLLEAQRALIAAQLQVHDSARGIDLALANAAGDMVRVADIELDQARDRLASALARNNKDDAQQARAGLISAEAKRAAAEITHEESEADFLHQMELISDAQYIARYRSILNLIPPEKIQERQRILLKLHELEKGTADDLNFDIPSQIKLPTLYEVRRIRQTEAAGSSYSDNRQINVQYNVLTAQDHQAALDDLLAVTAGGARVGAIPQGY